jgi:hypothetical protein
MPNITVWSSGVSARAHQLSDNPADGTEQEQIAHLYSLEAFSGYTCVSEDYSGPIPAGNLMWDGRELVGAIKSYDTVTPRQVRLLLLQQGLLEQVEAMIATQDKATQITWDYALEFRRSDPLLINLSKNLGLSEKQIDQFFMAASAL